MITIVTFIVKNIKLDKDGTTIPLPLQENNKWSGQNIGTGKESE